MFTPQSSHWTRMQYRTYVREKGKWINKNWYAELVTPKKQYLLPKRQTAIVSVILTSLSWRIENVWRSQALNDSTGSFGFNLYNINSNNCCKRCERLLVASRAGVIILNKRLRFLTSTRPNKTPVVQAVPLRLSRALRWLFNEEDLVTTRAREKGAKLDVQSIKEKKNHKNSEKQIHKPGERRNIWNPFHLWLL